ncbi:MULTISPECIES: hypothetical protein [Cytobacillus]|uniref:hypothetical protein n=1 Tax=Cytobacillus TaxID=2675230 RepID=UPI001CD1AB8D|nr:hypothetical protein [Cytobacillus kochii]MCA1024651.1 hypothetical protein [Cytobacillus kochii]MCM3323355.1 hypothetical protein [Cytobacillus kochii]MCM3345750.1 hypothetical protein [Cytobacillus kochii]MDM5206336.1 hypothetical protein [Cytobacillus kochii]
MENIIPIAIIFLVFGISLCMVYWGISQLYRLFFQPKVQDQQKLLMEIAELKEMVRSIEREMKQQNIEK